MAIILSRFPRSHPWSIISCIFSTCVANISLNYTLVRVSMIISCHIYHQGISCRQYAPSTDIISEAFHAVIKYDKHTSSSSRSDLILNAVLLGISNYYLNAGYSLPEVIPSDSESFLDLLRHADTEPLQIYTVAASYTFEALAVFVSSKSLGTDLFDVSDEMAFLMGPVYLHRLTLLHHNRKEELKRLMLVAPERHIDSPTCKENDRISVMQAYGLGAAYLVWEIISVVNADSEWIMKAMNAPLEMAACELCVHGMRRRLERVLKEWKDVKLTIWLMIAAVDDCEWFYTLGCFVLKSRSDFSATDTHIPLQDPRAICYPLYHRMTHTGIYIRIIKGAHTIVFMGCALIWSRLYLTFIGIFDFLYAVRNFQFSFVNTTLAQAAKYISIQCFRTYHSISLHHSRVDVWHQLIDAGDGTLWLTEWSDDTLIAQRGGKAQNFDTATRLWI